jgi:CDP-diglyceride synthetase
MRSIWDKIGISASLMCLIHCLFTPVIVLFMPVLGEIMPHNWFHRIMFAVVLPVAVWAIYNGYRIHKKKSVAYLGAIGIAFFLAAIAVEHENLKLEYTLMIVAGFVLASAHWANLRACRLNHH